MISITAASFSVCDDRFEKRGWFSNVKGWFSNVKLLFRKKIQNKLTCHGVFYGHTCNNQTRMKRIITVLAFNSQTVRKKSLQL